MENEDNHAHAGTIRGVDLMSTYPDCYESQNVICKHVRSSITAYVDLNDRLPSGVGIVSGTVDTDAAGLIVDAVATVVGADTVIEADADCAGLVLYADRALMFTLSAGTSSDNEVIVTVNWVQDDGDEDSMDLRLLVGGRAA